MATLHFAPRASQDLIDLHDFIARDKPLAALHWIDKIEQKCVAISVNPALGEASPALGLNVRRSFLGRYIIYYRTLADGIDVLRIVAGDRDFQSLEQ